MKGIYLLIIELKDTLKKNIGAKGEMNFQVGRYIYVGSAQNGVKKRVRRHISDKKKKHWHIDYLLEEAAVREVMVYEERKKEECRTASLLEEEFGRVKGFGCSDCRCDSHLFYSKKDTDPLVRSIREIKREEDIRLRDIVRQ